MEPDREFLKNHFEKFTSVHFFSTTSPISPSFHHLPLLVDSWSRESTDGQTDIKRHAIADFLSITDLPFDLPNSFKKYQRIIKKLNRVSLISSVVIVSHSFNVSSNFCFLNQIKKKPFWKSYCLNFWIE